MTQKQLRNWCFTDFEKLDWNKIYTVNKERIRYVGVGNEVCPKTNRCHLQGWIQLKKSMRLTEIKKMIGTKKLHLTACNGNEKQNDKYCQKDGKFKKFGEYVTKGQRVDLTALHDLIKSEDKRVSDLLYDNETCVTYFRFRNGFNALQQLVDKKATTKFRVVDTTIITGPTGCNKTRNAVEQNPDAYKIHGDKMNWWDGYDGEKTLIIDEYANQIKCTELLGLLDGYQYRLDIKGGFTYARWTKVIITTNLKTLHDGANKCHRNALSRRIKNVDDRWPEIWSDEEQSSQDDDNY